MRKSSWVERSICVEKGVPAGSVRYEVIVISCERILRKLWVKALKSQGFMEKLKFKERIVFLAIEIVCKWVVNKVKEVLWSFKIKVKKKVRESGKG